MSSVKRPNRPRGRPIWVALSAFDCVLVPALPGPAPSRSCRASIPDRRRSAASPAHSPRVEIPLRQWLGSAGTLDEALISRYADPAPPIGEDVEAPRAALREVGMAPAARRVTVATHVIVWHVTASDAGPRVIADAGARFRADTM